MEISHIVEENLEPTEEVEPLIRLWMLRILVVLGAHRGFVKKHGIVREEIAAPLGLGAWVEPSREKFCANSVREELRSNLHELEEINDSIGDLSVLSANVSRLGLLLGLSSAEKEILAFTCCLQNEPILEATSDLLGPVSTPKLFNILSRILRLGEKEVKRALSNGSNLLRSGIVSISRQGSEFLVCKLELLGPAFSDKLYTSIEEPTTFLGDAISPSVLPELTIGDFEHLDAELSILRPYLKDVMGGRNRGVNVLIYGEPGTGKTQLVRALAQDLGSPLFEICSENEYGNPLTGRSRLRLYAAAQGFLANNSSLILFDEVEDVFGHTEDIVSARKSVESSKAWINGLLENNATPAFWVSNSIRCMDKAYIRRFDLVVKLTSPPKDQREKILLRVLPECEELPEVKKIVSHKDLSPAVIHRAACVARQVNGVNGKVEDHASGSLLANVELLISNTLEAQGYERISERFDEGASVVYDPRYLNADIDVSGLLIGLERTRSGRICLFGPPGTGKTACGKWLSEQLGMPLVTKRASDIMSKWVGGNEKNIANAFEEARQKEAIFLLDEADSFLRDRSQQLHGWEVSLVNEMLVQMERFEGVFIASTNLMGHFDEASLRRFDLKIELGYLSSSLAWELFLEYCQSMGLELPSDSSGLKLPLNLTPGDFAVIARRHRLNPFETAAHAVSALRGEALAKSHCKATIGFVH